MRSLLARVAAFAFAPLLLAGVTAGVTLVPTGTAQAATKTDAIVKAWKDGTPVYQEQGAGVLNADEVEGLNTLVADDATATPIYVAVLPQATVENGAGKNLVKKLAEAYGDSGTFITLGASTINAYSNVVPDRIESLTQRAIDEGGGDPQAIVTTLIDDVAEAAKDAADEPRDASPAGAGIGAVMLVGLGLLLLIAVAGGLVAVTSRRKRQQREAVEFAEVRKVAEEDVTKLGEDVAELDLDVQQADLDPASRVNYENALDAYDRSKSALASARRSADLRAVTDALQDGRYEMVCVRARIDGEPVPARRAPCFFNPQHGPSIADRAWTPPGGTSRDVPVCAADADTLDRGQEPAARQVEVDGVRRPYWEGGPAYAPWYGGYYGSYGVDGLLTGMLLGSVLSGGFGGFGGYGHDGGGDGGDGGGDGGDGGDFGGGDFGGGGDWGFGGGDFGDFGGGDF